MVCALLTSTMSFPRELIAQEPPAVRGTSRMLVMDRASGRVRDSHFSEFPSLLREGDLLVLNDSRVIPARLYARRTLRREKEKPTGRIEVMLTEPMRGNQWHALVRPGRKVAIGERLVFPAADGKIVLEAEVLERGQFEGSGCWSSRRWRISSACWSRSGTYLCRRIYVGTMLRRIASDIKLCFRESADQSRLRQQGCTSRRCWTRLRREVWRLRA